MPNPVSSQTTIQFIQFNLYKKTYLFLYLIFFHFSSVFDKSVKHKTILSLEFILMLHNTMHSQRFLLLQIAAVSSFEYLVCRSILSGKVFSFSFLPDHDRLLPFFEEFEGLAVAHVV